MDRLKVSGGECQGSNGTRRRGIAGYGTCLVASGGTRGRDVGEGPSNGRAERRISCSRDVGDLSGDPRSEEKRSDAREEMRPGQAQKTAVGGGQKQRGGKERKKDHKITMDVR